MYVLKQLFVQGFIIPLGALHLTYHIPGTPYLDDILLRVCCPFFQPKKGTHIITLLGMTLIPANDIVERTQILEKAGLYLSHDSAIYPFSEFVFFFVKKIATFQGIGVQ